MEQVTLTREELFELVWTTPMTKLAARFGFSDVGLAKTCERFSIPRPPQGHWARVAWNHKPDRPALPDAPADVPDVITFGVSTASAAQGGNGTANGGSRAPTVTVTERLSDPHSVTTYLEMASKGAEADKYGRLLVGRSYDPELCMRSSCVRRALLLLDALFKGLSERGHVVHMKSWGTPPSPSLTVTVAGQGDLHIRVEEKLADTPHMPTADERERHERWGWRLKKFDQVPNGHLVFKVEGANWQYKGPKSWSDTKRRRMEDLLGQVVATIESIADFNHREDTEMQARLRIAEARECRRLRGERLVQWRTWLAADLEEMAANWDLSQRVTEFLNAFEKRLPDAPTARAAAWLAAAREFAVRLDPLSSLEGVAKDLEPADEALAAFVAEQQRRNAQSAERK